MPRWIGFALAMSAAIILAILGTTPPRPLPANAPETSFSAARAMAHVRRVASAPHVTGTAENAAVRAYLLQQLEALGVEAREAQHPLSPSATARVAAWSKGTHAPTTLTNVVGVLPGKDRTLPALALMTHHDTVWGSPGAADATAGVATILEVLRAVRAKGQQGRDLVVLLTDAEEIELSGARAFFAEDPLRSRIGMIINMEARGGGGRTAMFETGPGNGAAMRLFADHVPRPGASSLAAYIYSVLPNDTDLSPAMRAGWWGYNFAFIGLPGLYHSPKATPERLDQGSLQDMGGQVLALTSAFLAAKSLPAKTADASFFDVFGLFLAIFPPWLGWVMLAFAAAALGLAARRARDWRGVGGGMARMLGLIVGSGVALYLLNRLSGAGPGAEYYDRLAAIPKLEVMAGLAGLAAFLLLYGKAQVSKPGQVGAALLLGLMALAAQLAAPTAAYVLVLPVLMVSLAVCATAVSQARPAAALVTGYMIYLGHFGMQAVGAPVAFVAALPLALAAATVLPVWPGASARTAHLAGAALLVLSLGMALWVRLDPVADTAAVYASDKAVEAIPITKPS